MPVETLTLPKDIVAAARMYAAREEKSIDELFADALRLAYGIDCSVTKPATSEDGIEQRRKPLRIATPRRRASERRGRKSDESWLDELDPVTKSLVGALRPPLEDASRSYKDILDEALAEKYGL